MRIVLSLLGAALCAGLAFWWWFSTDPTTALVDADIAWPAQLAGDIAQETKQHERARKAYQLARQQYQALHDEERVSEIEAALAQLGG